jgi:hypothetical protein
LGENSIGLASEREANRAIRNNIAFADCDRVDVNVRQRIALIREISLVMGDQTRRIRCESVLVKKP